MLRPVSIDAGATRLIDPFERSITYLRISLTDRCDFRCVYCMSENMTFLPKAGSADAWRSWTGSARAFVAPGRAQAAHHRRRAAGAQEHHEPLPRHVAPPRQSGALEELTLTTNGSQLAQYAAELADCGVRRVNVSLDTLEPAKFAEITRWGRCAKVMDGIDAAQAAGLQVKINAVALKGVNDGRVRLHDRLVRPAKAMT